MWQEKCDGIGVVGEIERHLHPLHRRLSLLSLIIAMPLAKSDAVVNKHNSKSSLSESLDTKTLEAMSMVPGSFRDLSETDENL